MLPLLRPLRLVFSSRRSGLALATEGRVAFTWKIDKKLRSFEAITEAEVADNVDFSYFFDAVDENTNYYQSLSDTVRKASSIGIEYNDLNEENSLIPQKTVKN